MELIKYGNNFRKTNSLFWFIYRISVEIKIENKFTHFQLMGAAIRKDQK